MTPERQFWLRFSGTRLSGARLSGTQLGGALEARSDIRHQIPRILDSDRHPQQARADTGLQTRGFLHAGMGHAGRMRDQTLDAAERFGEGEALESLRNAATASSPPSSSKLSIAPKLDC